MKKRILTLITGLFAAATALVQAQVNDDFEIVFTDDMGKLEYIELPEAMTKEVDSLLALYHSRTYLEMDTLCESNDVNPEYSDEVYIDRLQRMPTVMEMPYNRIVRQFIDRYCSRLRRTVSVMLGRTNFYMPIFEQALESYNLPLELKYLPVIESSLNPTAVSRAGATGLWQFMLATGKQYGLRVNSLVDDRRDPIRASYAAAQYLRDLYKIFGDWTLVIAAYNCGPENVNRAIRRAGGSMDYWTIYPYLPSETRGYVPAFIAANYVMTYYCEHNICPMITHLPAHTDTVEVSRDVNLQQIADVCGTDLGMLRELNPQYRRDIVNGSSEPSLIRMPIPVINRFIELEDSVYAYKASTLLSKRSLVSVNERVASTSSENVSRSQSSRYGRSRGSSASRSSSRYSKGSSSRSSNGSSSRSSKGSSSRYGKNSKQSSSKSSGKRSSRRRR